jgi:hypothetical protein
VSSEGCHVRFLCFLNAKQSIEIDFQEMISKIKLLFILFPVLLFVIPASGQGLQFGLHTGKSYAHMHGSFVTTAAEDIRVSLSPGLASRFTGGGYMRYYVTPSFSIQPELNFATRGGRIKENVDIRGRDMRINGNLMMRYIELPVLFRIGTWRPIPEPPRYEPSGYTYHMLAGVSASYNTRARFNGNLSGDVFGVDFDEQFSSNVRDHFRETDLSVVVGAGFEYGRDTRFTFDLRYVLSILDINDNSDSNRDSRNGTISAMFGILF